MGGGDLDKINNPCLLLSPTTTTRIYPHPFDFTSKAKYSYLATKTKFLKDDG